MEALTVQIRQKINQAMDKIHLAAQSVGRPASAVRLVVVSKAQPIETIRAAVEAGAEILGENYSEESLPKIQSLGDRPAVSWHMIGHLQSRKASIVAENFQMLQSLDSLHLAQKLERLLAERQRVLPVLLEFNVSGEESKYGWAGWEETQWERLLPEIEQVLALPHLSVQGLMTMPPLYDDPDQTRPYFIRLRQLNDFLARRYGEAHFHELSMGTSVDYPAAVQEGATLVRIGTAILGARPKKT